MVSAQIDSKRSELVLDTNFCMLPVRRKRDILAELQTEGYRLTVLPEVAHELRTLLERGSGASISAREAKATLQLLIRKGLVPAPRPEQQGKDLKTPRRSAGYADQAILAYCQERGAVAATHDNELRKLLRSKSVAVVTLGRSGALRTEE